MDKLMMEHLTQRSDVQALVAICAIGWLLRWLGDERVAAGLRRVAALLDVTAEQMYPAPDLISRPLAAAAMTAYGCAAVYMALGAIYVVAAAIAAEASAIRTVLAFSYSFVGMGMCLRLARISYERAWQQRTCLSSGADAAAVSGLRFTGHDG